MQFTNIFPNLNHLFRFRLRLKRVPLNYLLQNDTITSQLSPLRNEIFLMFIGKRNVVRISVYVLSFTNEHSQLISSNSVRDTQPCADNVNHTVVRPNGITVL